MTTTPDGQDLDQKASSRTRTFVTELFGAVEASGFGENFRSVLSDDLVFTVTGTSPLAGRYEGLQDYIHQVLEPLHSRLATPLTVRVDQMMVDDGWAAVRFHSADVRDIAGGSVSMQYCWLLHVEDDAITEIIGFYDSVRMTALMSLVPNGQST